MNGQLLVWDATCPDTFAPSYVSNATREAGAVAALAEERKRGGMQLGLSAALMLCNVPFIYYLFL